MDHPRGIEPFGNTFLSGVPSIRDAGLGHLHVLSDDLLLEVLGYLAATDLANTSLASKSLYCFATFEDLWKALVLQEFEGNFTWAGTWKETYHYTAKPKDLEGSEQQEKPTAEASTDGPAKKRRKRRSRRSASGDGSQAPHNQVLKVKGFYSDLLYQPWFCATAELSPEWLEVDNIDRRSKLTVEQFIADYELPNRPVVITDAIAKWPALKKWNLEYLAKAFKGHQVIAGNYEMSFDTYLKYSLNHQDEQPLYLFDKKFCKHAPDLAKDFSVPPYFTDDLFAVLGEDKRPDYRWLIIGPSRSGSSFHVDPNSTSAWNAVVQGCKKWIMYPPHITPPGVHPSPDGADVATPLSLVEWFLNFYQEAREAKVKPVECIVKTGELIFVPRGWWHLAINLEPSIAVTQNYVSRTSLPHVLSFLQPGRSDLVSGCSKEERAHLYERFVTALETEKPELMRALEADREAKRIKADEQAKLSKLFKSNKEEAKAGAAPAAAGFSFGFSV